MDGSLPLGELDAVDPDLAQFECLAAADTSCLPLSAAAIAFRQLPERVRSVTPASEAI